VSYFNILLIAGAVILVTVSLGIAAAYLSTKVADVTERTKSEVASEATAVSMTGSDTFDRSASTENQLKQARLLAAKRAAKSERGDNLRMGLKIGFRTMTASDAVETDLVTATRIAQFHSWEGLTEVGAALETVEQVVAEKKSEPAMTVSAKELVPGTDFPFIEIVDGMEPAEIRKARIANAKARSAAVKALKAKGGLAAAKAVVPAAATEAVGQATGEKKSAPAVTVSAKDLVPGKDYPVVEIVDGMDPAEIRKARIANAKARSAAVKALKAKGGLTAAVGAVPAAVAEVEEKSQAATAVEPLSADVAVAHAAPAEEVATIADSAASGVVEAIPEETPAVVAEIPSSIPRPDYIEIVPDMDPAELRRVRISNAKAKSAFVKALKAAGVDPSTVSLT